jgi:hypothetical protein
MLAASPETEAAAARFRAEEGVDLDTASLIEKFRFKVGDFLAAVNELAARAPEAAKNPTLKREYDALMSRAGTIKNTVQTVTGLVDKALIAFRSVTGMDGLGFIPLLPVAVIGAAVAAIAKWTTDAYTLTQRLNEVKRLEASGMSPQQAAATVAAIAPKPFFGGLPPLLPIAALVGLAFVVWRATR